MKKKLTKFLSILLSATLALSPTAVYAGEAEEVAEEVAVEAAGEDAKATVQFFANNEFVTVDETSDVTENISQSGEGYRRYKDSSETESSVATVTSADEKIATASIENGFISILPVSYGSTTVTFTSADETTTVPIKVNVYCSNFAIADQTMQVGDNVSLTPVFAKGYEFDVNNISFSSSDKSIVSTSGNKITALKNGEAIITAKILLENNTGAAEDITTSCKVTVMTFVSSIAAQDMTIPCGQEKAVGAVALPEDAKDRTLEYTSLSDLFTVTDKGVVTAGDKTGSGILMISSKDGSNIVKTITITITKAAQSIETAKDAYDMYEGTSFNLKAKVLPEDATNAELSYASSDEKVATVDEFGTVSLVAPGKAQITIREKSDENLTKTVDVVSKAQIYALTKETRDFYTTPGEVVKIPFTVKSGEDDSFLDLLKVTYSKNISDVQVKADKKEDGSYDTYILMKAGKANCIEMLKLESTNPTFKNHFHVFYIHVNEKAQEDTDSGKEEGKQDEVNSGKEETKPVVAGSTVKTTDITYTAVSETELCVTKLETDKDNLMIASKVIIDGKEYKVTQVADGAFAGSKAQKVVIKSGITKIGKNAFKGCKKLKSVTIPSTVTEIGSYAFRGCTSLTKVTIPAKVKKIGTKAFYGCKKLKSVTIKSTVLKNVGSKAFTGCNKALTIKVPKSKLTKYKKLLKRKVPAKAKIK